MSLHVRAMRFPLNGGDPCEFTQGTAFVVSAAGLTFLVTNRHVALAQDPITGDPLGKNAAAPSHLFVWHNSTEGPGSWTQIEHDLYDSDGRAMWLEHPSNPNWDIVALPIDLEDGVTFYPYSFAPENQGYVITPGSDLNIIGFPFGKSSAGMFAIWNRAMIASDLTVDYDNRPTFLVDSRSRPGQSGSPVIRKPLDVAQDLNGNIIHGGNHAPQLVGVYSGRISRESDIGIVWKVRAIQELVMSKSRSFRMIDE